MSESSTARRHFRPSLRQATLILPKTGERVKRAFTLRNPGEDRHGSFDERAPLLLPGSRLPSARYESTWKLLQYCAHDSALQIYYFATSKTGVNILKCSLAYLLGSLATFLPPISAFLGKNDGKHMVATITVYFHPARSAGSMQEATLLASVAFLYAAFVSFTSMAVSVFFGRHDLLALGHALILIIFCGGGLGLIGWLKQKLGSPLVNVACSLASLAIITILTKEGSVQAAKFSYDKVVQVLKMVILGIFATTAVSLVVKPTSARKELRDDLRQATDSLGEMLTAITSSFLSGSEEELHDPSYLSASNRYKSVFNSLVKNLAEAKYEHYILGTEAEYWVEEKLVRCLERLAQNIGGLRSAATTQFCLISKPANGAGTPLTASCYRANSFSSALSSPELIPIERRTSLLASIEELPEDVTPSEASYETAIRRSSYFDGVQSGASPADVFNLFIAYLGPPMKSLAYTLKEVLRELPFGPGPEYLITLNSQFRSSLVEASELFTNARKEALAMVYKNKIPDKAKSVQVAADYEEIAASCGYFSSSLQDFAEDMIAYLDILEEFKSLLEKRPRGRSWNWMFCWRKRQKSVLVMGAEDTTHLIPENPELGLSQTIPKPIQRHNTADLEKPRPPSNFTYRLWRVLKFLRRDDIRYAIKVGAGAVVYALWSFVPATRPIYSHWRGEWGLLSYMLVCSMTIGASNTTGFQRFLGTCAGALLAIATWIMSNDNPFALAFLGWLVSLGCFYIIIGQGKGPMGRFILLTYNLSALYAYSLSVKDEEDDDDEGGINPEIWSIVIHRVAAVTAGCLWGIIVTRLIWPISARKKLKDGICVLWLRMGLIWRRDPLAMLLSGASHIAYMDIRESLQLQRFLTHLETLHKSASYEFELRGPFPDKTLANILQATGRMLDAFHAMKVIILRDLKASSGEAELLKHTTRERMQLSSRISHLFSVLASSMKLEYPLNDALPNIEHTRDRLLARIFEFRKHGEAHEVATDEDYELLYAYALVTGQLAQDIETVGRDIETLYGVLDEDSLKLQ